VVVSAQAAALHKASVERRMALLDPEEQQLLQSLLEKLRAGLRDELTT
jgi:hypothetical protein